MGTERFDPERVIFTIRDSTAVHREEIAELFDALEPLDADEAEHLVAVSGEDERGYGPRPIERFRESLFALMDEFLADDDGGYREMSVHAMRHVRWPKAIEMWFQVRTQGSPTSVWFRHIVVRLMQSGTELNRTGRSSVRSEGVWVYASIGGKGGAVDD